MRLFTVGLLALLIVSIGQPSRAASTQFTPAVVSPALVGPARGLITFDGLPSDLQCPIPANYDVYCRASWTTFEGATAGSYNWSWMDGEVNAAAKAGKLFYCRIMPGQPGNDWVPAYVQSAAGGTSYSDGTFVPNWNSPAYISALTNLLNAVAARYGSNPAFGGFDISGYGAYGEWQVGSFASGAPVATEATEDGIVQANWNAFSPYPHVKLFMPSDSQYGTLYAMNLSPLIGWRRDSLGGNNGDSWDGYSGTTGLSSDPTKWTTKTAYGTMENRWKTAPILGELYGNRSNMTDSASEITNYHVSMMENGNCTYTSLSSTFQSAWAQCGVNAGYWYQVPSVTASQIGSQMSITSTWNNVGSAPIYEPFAATWQLRNSAGTAVWSLPSAVDLQTVLPGTPANVTDAATINVAAGTYSLCLLVSDTSGIRKSPLSLGISGQASGGWYVLGSVSVAAAGGLGVSAPTLSITSPTSGSTVSGSVTISATETDSSTVNSVAFSIDGTTIATSTTAPYSCTWNTASVSNGSHAITAVLEDSAGNAANASAAVTVNNADTTPPTVSITSPANGATVSGTTAVKATASDSAGVASVAFSVDGTVKSTATTAPYSYSWVTTDVANGSHTVTATAKDTGGNTASSSVTVTVSNASSGSGTSTPTIAITSPGNEAVVSGTVAISAAVTDSDPVTSVAFVVDRVTWATFKSAPYTCQWNSKTHSNGLHYIQAVVTDADGRTATAAIHVVIDNN